MPLTSPPQNVPYHCTKSLTSSATTIYLVYFPQEAKAGLLRDHIYLGVGGRENPPPYKFTIAVPHFLSGPFTLTPPTISDTQAKQTKGNVL